MKQFILKLVVFVAIQLAILVFVINYGSMDANTNEYMYSLKDKYDLLRETPSPRIILVGGSNLAFGIKSDHLKSTTGLNPVNMGLHGRLGVYASLRMIKDELRPGDVVVISPEFTAMFRTAECSSEIAIEAFRVWPGCKQFLQPDIEQPLESLVHKTTPLRRLGQCVVRARRRLESTGKSSRDGDSGADSLECYRRKSFNRFGDHIAHYRATSTYRENGQLAGIDDGVFERVARELNAFATFCQKKDANLYFLPPPIPSTKVSNHPEEIRHIDEVLRTELAFPLLTNMEMATFADDQFFDGHSHLTERGAQLRTEIVGQQIMRFERIADRLGDAEVR